MVPVTNVRISRSCLTCTNPSTRPVKAPVAPGPWGTPLRMTQRGGIIIRITEYSPFASRSPRMNRYFRSAGLVIAAAILSASPSTAQQAPAPLSKEDIAALARLEVAIGKIRDSVGAQLTMARNKKDEQQQELRDRLQSQVTAILAKGGLTEAEYRRRTFVISSDFNARKLYDSVIVVASGAPLPGLMPPAAALTPVPAGVVGTHIGHVINAFNGTPSGVGLLTAAIAESRIAATHAQLATRQPTNLDYMKTHAGHVINALDPTIVTAGPGQGYGVKKASDGVANHIELAAASTGASANVQLHAKHIATCARNTIVRADAMIALAQQIIASTAAADAAALVSQLAALSDQLMNGMDSNADGRVTPDVGEGGLNMADDHVKLMLTMEMR